MVNVESTRSIMITISGIVQGVGFRPFVYRLASRHGLKGWVRNTSGEVEIRVEGKELSIKDFLRELKTTAPPASLIESIESRFLNLEGFTGFEIQESLSQTEKYQPVSPDLATCDDCRREIFNKADRRYRYAFTNCTNCGPRFTIIKDIPYDRINTTMNVFEMCPDCRREYDNPADRRFHAQPNACPVCGPALLLVDDSGKQAEYNDTIIKAADLLRNGNILAVRGMGGYQLACDATNEAAVSRLRTRKHRPAKPLAVMLYDIEQIDEHCLLSPVEINLLKSPQAPIVLLKWKKESSEICDTVAPHNKYLGVMLPYTPLHHLLLKETHLPLIMTSGNMSEEPIAKDNDEALRRLKGIADYFLMHNRDIYARYDDSVYIVEGDRAQAVRRSRGYAPYPIILHHEQKRVLACGAEEKNTFCLTRDRHAFLSQHIGDLENEETLEHYENTIDLYKKLFRIEPEIVACDMHPEYLSTKYAVRVSTTGNIPLIPVQHHHAHTVSCMIENRLESPVIGVAFDGTGFGTDGSIWGGEFLIAEYAGFKRAGHLEYVPMPGGSAAVKKPYRMALSYLITLLGVDFSPHDLAGFKCDTIECNILKQQLQRKVNTPPTSSAGRLFDAVSALLGVCREINYSAQAAIELEMIAADDSVTGDYYPFTVVEQNGVKIVKLVNLFTAIIHDIVRKIPVPQISLKFHYTVAEMIIQMCRRISEESQIKDITLSGGVFQNRLLQKMTVAKLSEAGYNVFTHHLIPCNDGGIALGQAVIAGFK